MTQNKQITIFGGTGFIGRYVIDRLADQGFNIRVATRRPGCAYFLRPAGVVGQVTPVISNIHDDTSVENAIEGSDIVINLIGILAESGKKNTFDATHHLFPRRLSAAVKKAGVEKLIHMSAIGAGGVHSHYAMSKGAGEAAIREACPHAIILRPSIVFGEEDQFFNRFARMAMISPALPLIGGGKTKFQPIYVCDVAKAVEVCVNEYEAHKGQVFELGGQQVLSFKKLFQVMLQQMGRKRLLVPLPWFAAKIKGRVLQHLPGKLLTYDQVMSLKSDNIVGESVKTLADLGVAATPLDIILPTYLARFKPGGRFGMKKLN